MTEQACCFTGHRIIPREDRDTLQTQLEQTIRSLIEEGVSRFFTGGALGFDTMAAQTVLSLKEEYPHIQLHLVLPCPSQYKGWKESQVALYQSILAAADGVEYVSDEYTKICMFQRNRRLVELSDVCVAYLTRKRGGTLYTVNYARKQGLPVHYLCQTEDEEPYEQLSLLDGAPF